MEECTLQTHWCNNFLQWNTTRDGVDNEGCKGEANVKCKGVLDNVQHSKAKFKARLIIVSNSV